MKYTEQEFEIIEKSLYKAVHKTIKKALGTGISSHTKNKARAQSGKDAIDDLMDPNFVAEAKAKVPPKRTATMNKSEKGVHKLKSFVKSRHK